MFEGILKSMAKMKLGIALESYLQRVQQTKLKNTYEKQKHFLGQNRHKVFLAEFAFEKK